MAPNDLIPTSSKFQEETGDIKWNELESTAFDRIITSVHDFCSFMRSLYVPDNAILVPPGSGWEQITTESFADLGKSDKVIEALRHMTYIKCRGSDAGAYQVMTDTYLADYRSEIILDPIREGNAESVRMTTETYEPAPTDQVGLAQGGRSTAVLMLDCKYGIVHWHDCPHGETKLGQHFKMEAMVNDGSSPGQPAAWPVEEFFEFVKNKFRSMEQLPRNEHELVSSNDDWDGIMDTLREIYGRHGWPDRFKKAECAAEIKAKF